MRKVKLGIIGCGVIGTAHRQTALACDNVEVVAVADLLPERRERAAADFENCAAFERGEALIDSGIAEAVVLAVPAGDRIEMPLQALAKGLHVLIEKPAAINAAMLQRYIAARGDLQAAGCSSRFQALPSTQAVAQLVASGVLGPLRMVHCRVINSAPPPPASPPPAWRLNRERNAGGILCNWGCYDLDYLLTLTGWQLRPRTVLAQTWGVPPPFTAHVAPGSDAESYYSAMIRCDGGTVLTIERGEYLAAAEEAAWRIVGTAGSLRLQMLPSAKKVLYLDAADTEKGVVSHVCWEGDEDGAAIHQGPLFDFAGAILDSRPPRTTLERAMVIQRITDAIYASASNGHAVEIEG